MTPREKVYVLAAVVCVILVVILASRAPMAVALGCGAALLVSGTYLIGSATIEAEKRDRARWRVIAGKRGRAA